MNREQQMVELRFAFQGFIDTPLAAGLRTAWFTIDGAGYYRVTPGERSTLMTMAPDDIRALNGTDGMPAPAASTTPLLFTGDPARDIGAVMAVVTMVDAHLDAAAPRVFRVCPGDSDELIEAKTLLNRYRRISAGPASEGQEAVDALNLATGGNPRKGVIGSDADVLEELGDTALASLLAIQSMTKDPGQTWAVFLLAVAKAARRVPQEPSC